MKPIILLTVVVFILVSGFVFVIDFADFLGVSRGLAVFVYFIVFVSFYGFVFTLVMEKYDDCCVGEDYADS